MNELARMTFRMPVSLHEKLKKLAEEDKRSLTNYIVYVLEKHVKEIEQNKTTS